MATNILQNKCQHVSDSVTRWHGFCVQFADTCHAPRTHNTDFLQTLTQSSVKSEVVQGGIFNRTV